MAITEWVAYCIDCGEVVLRAPNGGMVEAMAQSHLAEKDKADHEVLVGFAATLRKG